jgi:hypothetical protein
MITTQYVEMASNKEALRYTVHLLEWLMTWREIRSFTYGDVEEYYFHVYRNIDPRFSVRTVERKIRELAENGYLYRERLGKTYMFKPTPAFWELVQRFKLPVNGIVRRAKAGVEA